MSKLLKLPRPPIILILGMRQVGKTTLAKQLVPVQKLVGFNFDLLEDRRELAIQERHHLASVANKYAGRIILIDEVQKMPEVTAVIKHLYDNYGMKFILTGSSELRIRKGVGDTLTGRLHEVRLYPLSLEEINIQSGLTFDKSSEFCNFEENQQLILDYLIFGSLPQIQNLKVEEYSDYLKDYVNSLISKDVLEIAGTRKPGQVYTLARLLALQAGQLVNLNELATLTEFTRERVYRYLDIFEQLGMIVRAKPISTNERAAVTRATKIYFTDLGVRNALVGDFSGWHLRIDRGQLLENAVFMGIKRRVEYSQTGEDVGFFRSESGAEIDIVKGKGRNQELFEVGVGKKVRSRTAGVKIINLENAQKYLY